MSKRIEVDPRIVEHYLTTLAQFGAYGETGVWRLVYSPEWVALRAAQEHGCDAFFCDLPAWDRAFEGMRHRFADRLARPDAPPHSTRYVETLCRQLQVDDVDTL